MEQTQGYDNRAYIRKYNNHNNLVEVVTLDINISPYYFISEYRYIYDKNWNWITRIHFKNGLIGNVAERKITYY